MDEMRGGASALHRGLADRDAQPDHPANIVARFGWKTGSHILAKML